MKMDDIIAATRKLAEDDQSLASSDITTWVDMAINRINIALQANIPTVSGLPTTTVPAFDPRFHESLVLFAVSKYREADSAYSDAGYFLNEFNNMLTTMQRDMELLPSVQVGYNWKQMVVTNATVWNYPLDIPYGSYFDDVVLYINDKPVTAFSLDLTNRLLKISPTVVLATNDKITLKIENNSDLNSPPYQWWGW